MKVVVLLSGGVDSSVLAAHFQEQRHDVSGLVIDYGQRHRKEIISAELMAAHLHLTHFEKVDLSELRYLFGRSSQTDSSMEVPNGHFEDDSMKQTVVPNRNMVLLSVAGAYAIGMKADAVGYAAHAGDHAIYPDCRPEFANLMSKALALADWHPIALLRPFIDKTKADIVRLGKKLGVRFDLTWSCYKGLEMSCGTCGTCVERKEAFSLAGVVDPLPYTS